MVCADSDQSRNWYDARCKRVGRISLFEENLVTAVKFSPNRPSLQHVGFPDAVARQLTRGWIVRGASHPRISMICICDLQAPKHCYECEGDVLVGPWISNRYDEAKEFVSHTIEVDT